MPKPIAGKQVRALLDEIECRVWEEPKYERLIHDVQRATLKKASSVIGIGCQACGYETRMTFKELLKRIPKD